MARRNLLAEAQAVGAAQVAPQVAALQNALSQAVADRNFAIHAAASAYQGMSGAIHRAGPQIRKNYREAQSSARATDAITAPAIAGSPVIAAAAAHEGRTGGRIIASQLAARLSDLSNRRIAAAAGRAFQVGKAVTDYNITAATNAQKMQQVGAQQGLYTAAALSKLTESAAGRQNQRLMQERSLNSQAALQSNSLASQQAIAGARLQSSEAIAGARLRSSEHNAALSRRQQKLGRQNQRFLQNQRLKEKSTSPAALSSTTIKGRQSILAWKQAYDKNPHNMSAVHAEAQSKNVPQTIIYAASNLSSKGYIAPREVHELQLMGVSVPKEWTGVQVQSHTRRRRGK